MVTPKYEMMPWSDLGPARTDIERVKPIRYETTLMRDEKPSFVIVAPDDPRYRDLGLSLQEAIQGTISGPERVIAPSAFSVAEWGDAHVIALGSMANNSLLLELYHAYYVATDDAYPGPGGHVLQTVYDPWGLGNNVIVCGGSDLAGVAEAVRRAIRALKDDNGSIYYDRLHDIVISQAFMDRYPGVSFHCTDEYRRELVALAYRRIEQGEHRRAMPVLSHTGLMYHLTGDDRFAEAYRDVFKVVYQSASNQPSNSPWSPWGFDADFQSAPVLGAWDVVEESPVLTEEDRLYMTNHLLWYVQYMYDHARTHKPAKPSPRHNHYTFAALGLLLGAKYFAKYYAWPEAEAWLQEVDECFQPQTKAFKANEDCNSYQWLTFYHTLRYALLRPDPSFIESGMARFCLDLGIATMDNLGYQVPYGDVREYTGTFSEVTYYRALASLLKDPAYSPVLARKAAVRSRADSSSSGPPNSITPVGYDYHLDLGEGRPLGRHLGVSVLPVEPLYYEAFDGPQHMPYEKTFDKIVFRQAYDPGEPYLLVDGLSNGGHLHYDGNAILRYTDKERIWLEDADYMKSPTKFHNSILVFKDGKGELIPPFMEFGEATKLAPFAYSRSTARGYAGTDWTRHVLQVSGTFFVVADEIVANEAAQYDLRCLWRGVGNVSLRSDERALVIEQGGPQMELRCAPGHTAPTHLYMKEEPMIWGSWDKYPYHGDTADTKVLQERASVRLEAGERYLYFNLFGTEGPYPDLQRLGEEAVRLSDTGAVVGTGRGLGALTRIECDAAFCYADSSWLLLAGVTTVSLNGKALLRSGAPLTLSVGGQDTIRIVTTEECHITTGSETISLAVGENSIPVSWAAELLGAVSEIRTPIAPRPQADSSAPEFTGGGPLGTTGSELLWDVRLPNGETPYCQLLARPAELYIGTVQGSVHCVREGRLQWSFHAGGRVNSVCADDVNDDGRPEVIVGSAGFCVYLLDEDGHELWRHELPHYLHDPTVEAVTTASLGQRGGAVIAGSNNCHVHALDPSDGHELWRFEVIHGVNDMASVDMTGNGVDEILAVTEWWTWHCIDASGQGLWKHWAVRPNYAPGANVVRAGDVDGDGTPEMIVGSIDTCVYCFDNDGERVWEFFTGEEIAALALVDTNGSGRPEIIAGSMNGYVYALDGQGKLLWQVNLGDEVNSLTALSDGLDVRIVAGTDGRQAFVLGRRGDVQSVVDTHRPVRQVAAETDGSAIILYVAGRDGTVAAYRARVPEE